MHWVGLWRVRSGEVNESRVVAAAALSLKGCIEVSGRIFYVYGI